MRIVVYGAGAIGGVIGARLFQHTHEHGHEVLLIARGLHGAAIAADGLRFETPQGVEVLPIACVQSPGDLTWHDDDVVVLAMKSQDSEHALRELGPMTTSDTPIVCAQNGVENERTALRSCRNVYGMCVMCPATHLAAGVVRAHSVPVTGILDLGRWPSGTDDLATELAETLAVSTFVAQPRADIARWKYSKLLMNLANAVEAICGRISGSDSTAEIARMARREGESCLAAAEIRFVGEAEEAERRGDLITVQSVLGEERGGGSSWQSLARATGAIEADYLNGEIVLLGRLHGVPTPVNETLQRVANDFAVSHRPPGSMSGDELMALLAF